MPGYVTCFKNDKNEIESIFTVDNSVLNSSTESPELKPALIKACAFYEYYDKKIGIASLNKNNQVIDNSIIELDTSLFKSFINQNEDKYTSEVHNIGSYDIKTKFKTNYLLNKDDLYIHFLYDSDKNILTFKSIDILHPKIILSSECNVLGTYTGSNIYGVKADIIEKSCLDYYLLPLTFKYNDNKFNINITPSEYRSIKKEGVNFDIYFTISGNNEKIIAENKKSFRIPTIAEPFKINFDSHIANIKIFKMDLKIPNKEPLTIFEVK